MPANEPMRAFWIVNAPWAHPVWNNYALLLTDLTTDTGEPPVLYAPDMTHELIVFALHPDRDREYPKGRLPTALTEAITVVYQNFLRPPNHIYQFRSTDAEAVQRVESIYRQVVDQKLSPDTDFRAAWDALYQDWIGGHTQTHLQRTQ